MIRITQGSHQKKSRSIKVGEIKRKIVGQLVTDLTHREISRMIVRLVGGRKNHSFTNLILSRSFYRGNPGGRRAHSNEQAVRQRQPHCPNAGGSLFNSGIS